MRSLAYVYRVVRLSLSLLRALVRRRRAGIDDRLRSVDVALATDLLSSRGRMPVLFWWPYFVGQAIRHLRRSSDAPHQLLQRAPLRDFPEHIPLVDAEVSNFAGDERTRAGLPIATPWDDQQIAEVVNWARQNNKVIRVLGNQHSWSPGTVDTNAPPDLLLDLRRFNTVTFRGSDEVTCEAAVTIEQATAALAAHQPALALACSPAIREATIGGLLSTGAHGSGLHIDDGRGVGHRTGTINALVTALDAVVRRGDEYVVTTLAPGSAEFQACCLALGGALVVRASFSTVKAFDLVEHADAFFLEEYFGTILPVDLAQPDTRYELMWLPHQGRLRGRRRMRLLRRRWYTPRSHQSREKAAPQYADPLINFAAEEIDAVFRGALVESTKDPRRSRRMGRRFQTLLSLTRLRAERLHTRGRGRLYATSFTPRFHAAGWCLIVERAEISATMLALAHRLHELQEELDYPLDGCIEVRFTDLDGVQPEPRAALSPCRAPDGLAVEEHCAVWFNVLSDLDRAGRLLYCFEQWLLGGGVPGVISTRPEWPKGWGYDESGVPWSDSKTIARLRAPFENCAFPTASDVAAMLREKIDPDGVFTGPLARRVLF